MLTFLLFIKIIKPTFIHFRLTELDAYDRALVALATAKNNLESFIYDIRDKLEHDAMYKKSSTTQEQKAISEKLTEIAKKEHPKATFEVGDFEKTDFANK